MTAAAAGTGETTRTRNGRASGQGSMKPFRVAAPRWGLRNTAVEKRPGAVMRGEAGASPNAGLLRRRAPPPLGDDYERGYWGNDFNRGDPDAFEHGQPIPTGPRTWGSGMGSGVQGRAMGQGRHFDPDYQQWRNEQLERFDDDFEAFRRERYGKFADEFNTWRSNRANRSHRARRRARERLIHRHRRRAADPAKVRTPSSRAELSRAADSRPAGARARVGGRLLAKAVPPDVAASDRSHPPGGLEEGLFQGAPMPQHAIFLRSSLTALLCAGCLFSVTAWAQGSASQVQRDRAACDGVQQDREACRREAGAAKQESQRGGLTRATRPSRTLWRGANCSSPQPTAPIAKRASGAPPPAPAAA